MQTALKTKLHVFRAIIGVILGVLIFRILRVLPDTHTLFEGLVVLGFLLPYFFGYKTELFPSETILKI